MFLGLEAETSLSDIQGTQLIQIPQNFVKPNYCQLQNLTKILSVDAKTYKLRDAIAFHSGQRSGLRMSTGHYSAFVLRTNDMWEHYDDTKKKVTNISASYEGDIEFLIYTI